MDVQKLQNIIDTSSNPKAVEVAQKQLDSRLQAIGNAQVQIAADNGGSDDAQLNAIMSMLQQVVSSKGLTSTSASVDPSEVRSLILKEMQLRKIELEDLSNSLRAWLNSTRNVNLTINANGVITKSTMKGSEQLNTRLAQLILSDAEARNNVYLYGAAGTGKTYIASIIAKSLNYELITLNCNQYTSPLDIVGGQTIEGYQEGKLVIAWSNRQKMDDGNYKEYEGCVLLLDELPKIDPNTAGILNEALAKVKDFRKNPDTNVNVAPTIMNGKNQKFSLKNMIVIATGNVPLNTIDPDYEANFKQDLSLQDRFIGSTYKVFYNYRNEFESVMNGYAFIFIFLVKVRQAIIDPSIRATSQAFVSTRLMENTKATYKVYREVIDRNKSIGNADLIQEPKTLENSLDTFFELFKETQKQAILQKVDYDGFKQIIAEKNKMPFNPNKIDFNTPQELEEGLRLVEQFEQQNKGKI